MRIGVVDTPEQVRRVVSVGTLVLLRVGSLWQNRRCIGDEDAEIKDFDDVKVDEPDLVIVKAGHRDNSGFIYPRSEHPWHMQSTASYCAYIKLSGGRALVIPCFEILRFYFGSSAGLLTRLFKPDLKREDLYVPSKTYVRSGCGSKLQLADGISNASGIDIARIAGNTLAWRSAVNIGKSILINTEKGRFVRLSFPFSGSTKLKVKGKWLSSDIGLKRAFAVYQLLQCSHPLPFNSLIYKSSGTSFSDGSQRNFEVSQLNSTKSAKHNSDHPSETPTLVEQDPGRLNAKQYEFYGARKFIDLKNKKVRGQINNENTRESAYSKKAHLNEIAIGAAGSAPDVRSIDLVETNTNFDTAPQFLQTLLTALSIENIRFKAITTAGDDGWSQPLTQFQYFSDLASDLTLMAHEHNLVGPPRPRLLSIILGRHENLSAIWIVIENGKIPPMLFPTEVDRWEDSCEIPQLEIILSAAATQYQSRYEEYRSADEMMDQCDESGSTIKDIIREWFNLK